VDIITITTAADRHLEGGADGINPGNMKKSRIKNTMEIEIR
jgi:hypothetical protein